MLNPKAASRRTESKVPGILSNTQNMRLPRNSCHFKAPRGTNLQQHKNRKAAAAKTKISKAKKNCVRRSQPTRAEQLLAERRSWACALANAIHKQFEIAKTLVHA